MSDNASYDCSFCCVLQLQNSDFGSDEEGLLEDDSLSDSENSSTNKTKSIEAETTMNVESENSWQKDIWQFKHLPYYDEMMVEADEQFKHIKYGLVKTILLRDIHPGLVIWLHELEKYIGLYSRRFSKSDHICLVKLCYSCMTMKDADFQIVKICAQSLTNLLYRRKLLSRRDLILDWKPLYDIHVEVSHKGLEQYGMFLLPDGIKSIVEQTVAICRTYFSLESTQQILDEVRPFICPWDESMLRAMSTLNLFLPTCMEQAVHKKHGAVLWFEEIWHWFTKLENNSVSESKLGGLLARLARECPGLIDWHDKYDVIMTRILRTLNLEVGQGIDRVKISSVTSLHIDHGAVWVAYMLGGEDNGIQSHLTRLFNLLESYLYPSNYGVHSVTILHFLLKLVNHVSQRLHRERYQKSSCHPQIPANMRLTNAQLDEFVESVLPCVKLSLFAKYKIEYAPAIIRSLSHIAPRIVVPAVLDLVYPALESVIEPHRLVQSMNALTAVCVSLARDNSNSDDCKRAPLHAVEAPSGRPYRNHAIVLLNSILPGLDANDISKSLLTFQVINLLFTLIPVVDCSEAVYLRNDLTEEEKEVCSATANFETIVENLMDKLIEIIHTFTGGAPIVSTIQGSLIAKTQSKLSVEEAVIKRGIFSVFRSLLENCSTSIYKIAVNKLYDFVATNIYDNRVAADTVSDMVFCAARTNPPESLDRFLDLIIEKLVPLITEEVYGEEDLDTTIVWYLVLASQMFRMPGLHIVSHKNKMLTLLRMILPLNSRTACELSCKALECMLTSLTFIYIDTDEERRKILDQSLECYLPVRNWAKLADKKTFQLKWHIPIEVEFELAYAILDEFFYPQLKKLSDADSLSKTGMLKSLEIVSSCLSSISGALPPLGGKLIQLTDSPIEIYPLQYIIAPSYVKVMTYRGSNIRDLVFERIKNVAEYLLHYRENDTKSLSVVCRILNILVFQRGIDRAKFELHNQNYLLSKKTVGDAVKGKKANIEKVVSEYLLMHHFKRTLTSSAYYFTTQHLEIMRLLVRLGTSLYSATRIQAQKILSHCIQNFFLSYRLILDDILSFLKESPDISHEQFKGALYMLLNGEKFAICVRRNWATLEKVWPALIEAQHSEKPSVIDLLDLAQNTLIHDLESFQIKFQMPEEPITEALKLYSAASGDGVHRLAWLLPNEEEIKASIGRENSLCQHNEKLYYSLCNRLLTLTTQSNLHWRHFEMAQCSLSLLIRRDMPYPPDAIKLFIRLLVNDTYKTRCMATALLSAWFRITKPKAKKIQFENPVKLVNAGPGAVWPVKYGYRMDNMITVYDNKSVPRTAENWNSTIFSHKMHLGFYTWPKIIKVPAPANEQKASNLTFDELSEVDRFVVETFRDEEFALKYRQYMSVEEKKCDESFDSTTYAFFYGLFRKYNDLLLPTFKKHFEILLNSKKEGEQRLASEMTAGLVNGSKLWTFEKILSMTSWLRPLLFSCLETIEDENTKCWTKAFSIIFSSLDPKALSWLIEMLFALSMKPTDSSFHATTRLHFLHIALGECEWRVTQLWNQLFERCLETMEGSYQNLREGIGTTIATILWFDQVDLFIDPQIPKQFHPKKIVDAMNQIDTKLELLWNEVSRAKQSFSTDHDYCITNERIEGNGGNGWRKAIMTFKCALNYMDSHWMQSFTALPPAIFNVLPLLLHFENETSDEELKYSCRCQLRHGMSQTVVVAKNVEMVLCGVKELSSSAASWWKPKVSLLKYLQVAVFSNFFVFFHHRTELQNILCCMILDFKFEVRIAAATTLSGFFHCRFLDVENLLVKFYEWSQHENDIKRHAGILALSAVVQAFPYSVPSFLPKVLMQLCSHTCDKQPIQSTVKKALSEFKRTHHDNWHEHKMQFSEDQLSILTDLFVSPNYYV
ncbi:unnamed protein product [Thelazia callipaeda]|uniref:BLM10_mid domain-containing protein n=1 Tax=Thelazia callipaeda TaxID=103827 RepID=A0A158RB42_THECL|nr:unnamed protein product [Thelazia callipaeda]